MTDTDYDRIVFILNLQTHKTKVRFALHCAYDALENVEKEDKLVVEKTLDTVSKWLETGNVTAEELKDAAHAAAYAAAHAAAYASYASYAAAHAAAYASYAAAHAAANASYAAAHAAANAAKAAAHAAANAAKAAYAAKEETYKQYLNYLLKISDFTELEKELYIT